jgi:pimeloyl-ACP methyl ester carboxylesterase
MKLDMVGQGPALIYLHDWGFQTDVWRRQVDFFRGRYRNILIDYALDPLPADVTHETLLERVCEAIEARLDPADRTPKAILAHGLGAYVAYELMQRGVVPGALVLLGGFVRFTNGGAYLSGLAPERVAELRKELHEDSRQMLRHYRQLALSAADETVPEAQQPIPFESADFLKVAFDTLASHDYVDVLDHLTCRALVIQGEEDRLCPVWQGELLRKRLKHSAFFLCRGAGHVPFATQYAQVNRRLEQFLEDGA